MGPVNIHDAKTHFSRLVERAERGEEIVIARNGKPVARIVPLSHMPRQFGRMAGKIWIADDFNDPLPPDLQALFEGEDEDAP
jgi:prevent-host-death family protein